MNIETAVQKQSDQEPRTLEPAVRDDPKDGKIRLTFDEKLRKFLIKRPRTVLLGWSIVGLAFLLLIPVAFFFWYFLPLGLWKWASAEWAHWVPAFLAYCILFFIPIWVAMLPIGLANFFAEVSFAIEDTAIHKAQEAVRETEQDAINRLEQTDAAGLLPLLRYNRAQLDAYYEIGLKQTRGSFYNAVVAMWLGFILLLVGTALYVGPVEKLGLIQPPPDFNILILSGAAIVEFISALFLWVYRSTTAQLTYYYKLQMHNHTSILCFRMASTMQQADETKRTIIEKVLEWTAMPERPPLVGAKGLRNLLSTTEPKASAKVEE
jgi:hypothetical protein